MDIISLHIELQNIYNAISDCEIGYLVSTTKLEKIIEYIEELIEKNDQHKNAPFYVEGIYQIENYLEKFDQFLVKMKLVNLKDFENVGKINNWLDIDYKVDIDWWEFYRGGGGWHGG